jgi:hypothetical protein
MESSDWDDLRRSGGAGSTPIMRPIGVMMMMLLPLGALAHTTGQNQMTAAMLVGIIFGSCNLDAEEALTSLSLEVNANFIELGNVLVLFFAGLAGTEYDAFRNYAATCVKVGLLKVVWFSASFAGIAYGSGLCDSPYSIFFFGFACSLSSKKILLNFLEKTDSLKSMHGRLLQGMAVVEDALVLVALTVLFALRRCIVLPPPEGTTASNHSYTSGNATNSTDRVVHPSDVDGINFHKLPENITHVGAGPEIWRAIGIQLLVWAVVRKFDLVLKYLSSGTKISQLQVHRLNKFRLLEFFFNFCEHDGEMMFIWRLSTAVYRDWRCS